MTDTPKKSVFELLEELDRQSEPVSKDVIVKAPFGYPGGKSKSVQYILPQLPYREAYIEPFGGSGAVLLARHQSPLEVFNDRYAGVTAFYRVLRDERKTRALCDKLELTMHSREDFTINKETWEACDDDVERAYRWYVMTTHSFAGIGRNWGRATKSRSILANKIHKKIPEFLTIHDRMKHVQVENQDWENCIKDYDTPDAVFYIDPPYLDMTSGAYAHVMSLEDHQRLLHTVMNLHGFVAVSGYSNPLYENQSWDNRFEWDVQVTLTPMAFTAGNNKSQLVDIFDGRPSAKEVLWIREAKVM
jgi:DNA adenine methylase